MRILPSMNRLWLTGLAVLCAVGVQASRQPRAAAAPTAFSVVDATIPDMQAAFKDGRVTSRRARPAVSAAHRHLRAPAQRRDRDQSDALAEADARRCGARGGHIRGPLHGIPIALKDNIHTTNMPTTGGALVFDGFMPPYEATLTRNLRDAGAIIIAKTGMTELANWVRARRRCRATTTRSRATG